MVELLRVELATAQAERIVAGGNSIEVAEVKITDSGRQQAVSRSPRGRRPPPGRPPAFECQTYGDETGGGIARCY
jgi:hypothetical protein